MPSRVMLAIAATAVILALCVVMLGAYTRLTNAGLGCPDWPGCYGHIVLPSAEQALNTAQNQFPDTPIEVKKAWTEMVHRYAAGTLALLIFFMAFKAFRSNNRLLPALLVLLVLFQAALGMWTVTLKLLPVVVMAHLLGGILIFSILCCLFLQMSQSSANRLQSVLPLGRKWIGLGVFILLCQIALGGWVSANYAGIACVGFPQCNGQWLPTLHLSQGFNLFSTLGTNYQGGVLDSEVRVTIQYIHRLGALVTALYVLALSLLLGLRVKNSLLRFMAWIAILLVVIQFSLGIMNVLYLLPIQVAVAHNAVAALLMATLFMMFYLGRGRENHAH